jgi:uncharacterized phiE125 gp8 family phage protein
MALRWESKRPSEVRTYQIDWADFLGVDTIATHTLTATGVTVDNGGGQGVVDVGNKSITVKLSGGTSGTLARLTNTIVTAAGETEAEKIVLLVSDYSEPISLELAKLQCRIVDDTSEDALLCSYVRGAREFAEEYIGRALVRRSFTEHFAEFPAYFEILRRPLVSVAPIAYTDEAGAAQTFADFTIANGTYPARVYPETGATWPAINEYGGVDLIYTAGYDEGEVPQRAIQAMLLIIGHWYNVRAAVNVGNIVNEVPLAATDLLNQLRPLL